MVETIVRELIDRIVGLLRGVSFGNVLAKPARILSQMQLPDFSLSWFVAIYNPFFALSIILAWAVAGAMVFVFSARQSGDESFAPNQFHPIKTLIVGVLFPLLLTGVVMITDWLRDVVNAVFDNLSIGSTGNWLDIIRLIGLPMDLAWFLPGQFAAWVIGTVLDFEAYLNTNLVYIFSILALLAYGLKDVRIKVRGHVKHVGDDLFRNSMAVILGLSASIPVQILLLRFGAILVDVIKPMPSRAAIILVTAFLAALTPLLATWFFKHKVVPARIFGGHSNTDGKTKARITDSTTLKVAQEDAKERTATIMLKEVKIPDSVAAGNSSEAPSAMRSRVDRAVVGVTNAGMQFGRLAPGILRLTGNGDKAAVAALAARAGEHVGAKILDRVDPDRSISTQDHTRHVPAILKATGHRDAERIARQAMDEPRNS